MHRHIKVAERHQRFDMIFPALLEDGTVKSDAFRIRRQFITIGIETAPGNRSAEHAEPHFRHQRDILRIAVIEIDGIMAGIKLIVTQGKTLFQTQFDRHTVWAVWDHIDGG